MKAKTFFHQICTYVIFTTYMLIVSSSVGAEVSPDLSRGIFTEEVSSNEELITAATTRSRIVRVDIGQFLGQQDSTQSPVQPSPTQPPVQQGPIQSTQQPSTQQPSSPPPDRITVNLFDDVIAQVKRSKVYQNSSGSSTWVGEVESSPNSTAIFIINDNTIYGSVEIPGVGNFSIKPTSTGAHLIEQINDTEMLSGESDAVFSNKPTSKRQSNSQLRQLAARAVEISNDDGSIIDVFVGYDQDAQGGSVAAADAQAYAELFIAFTNQAYENSGINQRVWLVGEVTGFDHTDTDSASLSADLDAVTNNMVAGLNAKRDEYHADLVLFFTPFTGNSCSGLANLQTSNNNIYWDDAFSVMEACSYGKTVFAHELGHNMGGLHDWYVSEGEVPASFAHGYVDPVNKFGTIMSYSNRCFAQTPPITDCASIPYFSNPAINYNGATTGVAAGTSTTCSAEVRDQSGNVISLGDTNPNPDCDADNATNFNNKALTTSQFRDSRLTWTGLVNSNWTTAGNWVINEGAPGSTLAVNRVPRAYDNVFIPSGLPTYPTITGTAVARELTIQSGATLNMTGGDLTVGWSWEDSGGFVPTAGIVEFSGPIGVAITSTSAFKDVQIGSGSDTSVVSLETNLNIDGNLVIKAGAILKADSHTINISGNWTEEDGIGFKPETSTVIFDGISQFVSKVTNVTILDEDFSAYDNSCCTTALPTGWSNSNGSYLQGGLVINTNGATNRWRNETDGYLFTLGVPLHAGVIYQLQYDVATRRNYTNDDGSLSPQTVSVHLNTAQTTTGLTTLSAEASETSTVYQTRIISNITVPSSGTYYIAFRAQQSGNDYTSFDNITLTGAANISFYNAQIASGTTTFTENLAIGNNLQTNMGATANFSTHDITVEGVVTNNGAISVEKIATNGTTTSFGLIKNATGSTNQYYGVDITPTGDMGSTTVEIRGNQTCAASGPPATGVQRCYDITPSTNQTAVIKLYYRSAESNSNTAPDVYHQTGGSWAIETTSSHGGSGDSVWAQANTISNYSLFSLSENAVNPNTPPVAVADSHTTNEDTQLTILVTSGILDNDTDANNDPLTASLETDVNNGTLTLNSNGSFVYDPDSNFNGSDSFTYKANDGLANSNIVTVSLTIQSINDIPAATADSYSINEDSTLTVSSINGVLSNDTDIDSSITASLVTNVNNGLLTLQLDGSFSYEPTTNFNGSDSFTYKANDGLANSNVVTVLLTVNPVNDLPTAVADSYTLNESSTLTVPSSTGVLNNDTDADSDSLTAELVSDVSSGVLTLQTDGSFSYEPNTAFTGSDSFSYRAKDGTGNSNVVTVTFTVTVNQEPIAVSDSYTTPKNETLTVPATTGVLSNDTDANGDSLTVTLGNSVSNGQLTLNSDGSFTYVPNADFIGSDSFTYTSNDGLASSASVTVSLTIEDSNAANIIPIIMLLLLEDDLL